MSSPDWTEYVDLTAFDKTATEIFDEAVEYAHDTLPEWVPEVGNIEVVLLEAIATEAMETVRAANRVPGSVVEALLKLFDIDRDDGVKATATVTVTLTTSSGDHTIPAETPFGYFPTDGSAALIYTLDEDLDISDGELTGTGAVTAYYVGVDHNLPSLGDALQVMATIPYIQSVVFATAPTVGADPETDAEYFARAIATLASYTSALVTPTQIEAWVLTNYASSIYRCNAYDRHRSSDRDTTDPDYTTHDGHVLVVVAAENDDLSDLSDVVVTAEIRQAIEDDLEEYTNVGLQVDVVNAELIDVSVTLEVIATDGYTSSTVESNITDALDAYLTPNAWDWHDRIRMTDLIVLIGRVEGVDHVVSISAITSTSPNATVDGDDLAFNLLGSLPYPDTYTITVS